MRTFVVCTILVFCFSFTAFGQKYETFFYGEDTFNNQKRIPNHVLKVLKQDEWVQRCFVPNSQTEFSSDLFETTNINLNNDNLPDLLIKGKDENNCINGNAISFWAFTKRRNGYDLVLFAYTISVEIGKKQTKGYYNITTRRSTANTTYTTFYAFNGRSYVENNRKEKPVR